MRDTEGTRTLNTLRAAVFIGLSLSIGWGVRGNFGHEYGAMLPGVLSALAGVLMLGRLEWLPRVAYFAFFGAAGWAFGGSISYMQVISYTHSGHLPSQVYGFGGLFVIGLLWAGMGGLATAWPAVASHRSLSRIFRPICWVFVFWVGLHFLLRWLASVEANYIDDRTWQRQASALYWMDSDWIEALTAGVALMAFDLWDRRLRKFLPLVILAAGGAVLGWLIQWSLTASGLVDRVLVWPLIQYQADPALLVQLAQENRVSLKEIQSDALTNWPNWFQLYPQHVGWIMGLVLGLVVYFSRYGQFRSRAGLLMSMVVGWYVAFLLMPVLLGFGGAGLRMTPPRGDNWAGILGVFVASLWWLWRHGYGRVVYAGLLSGVIGGFGFAAAACIKLLMVAPGNPHRIDDPAIIDAWRFWQQSNWHSFLEQTYGLINGFGICLALYWLSRRSSRIVTAHPPTPPNWTHSFAIVFVLFGVIFLNMQKNVQTWVEQKVVPEMMRLPGFESVNLSASAWFYLAFAMLTILGIRLLQSHRHSPLPWIPSSWIGRGQLLYLIILWIVVVMNFERAVVRFTEGRILTEGMIFLNAVLVSWMVSRWPTPEKSGERQSVAGDSVRVGASWTWLGVLGTIILTACTVGMPSLIRSVYGDRPAGHAGLQKRFGPDALWRTTPIFKSKRHS